MAGYLACSAAQPAGAAALAEIGAQMPAKSNATSAAWRNPARAVDRRVRASVENRLCICFLLRRCHGLAMFQVRREPTVTRRFQACLGAHKKLDRPVSGFRHGLRKLWAAAVRRGPLLSGTKMDGARFYPPIQHRNVVNEPIPAKLRTVQKPLIWLEFHRYAVN
jgi:hypothetical protein